VIVNTMNFENVISPQHLAFRWPVREHPRLAFTWGALLLLIVTLTGCSTPVAAGQVAVPLKADALRPVIIESAEVAYLSIANATDTIVLSRWQSAGWKLGSTIGVEDAVPTDCALHAREGADTQVYAACVGPMTVSIPPNGADIIYVTLIIGQDDQVRSANVIAPN
jgi:hypothetical protein